MNILANYPPSLKQQSFIPVDSHAQTLEVEFEDLASQYSYIEANFRDIENNKSVEGHKKNIQINPKIQLGEKAVYTVNLEESVFPAKKIYKGQIRFVDIENDSGKNDPNQNEIDSTYKVHQASEWSGWFLFKRLSSINDQLFNISLDSTQSPVATMTLSDYGASWFITNCEIINKYKYLIYLADEQGNKTNQLLEESEWIQVEAQKPYSYQFKSRMQLGAKYYIAVRIQTQNLYETEESTSYVPSNTVTDSEINMDITCKVNSEDGVVEVYLTKLKEEGNAIKNMVYAISRSSEKDGYKNQELLTEIVFEKEGLFYTDYTVEDGVKYKYSIQRIVSEQGARGGFKESKEVEAKLEYAYLWDGTKQLKIKYNNKLSSFKHNILAQKQETIGGKYPTIYRNGTVNYLEFPIGGLISLHMDENNHFFNLKEDGYYYNNELVISIDKFRDPQTGEVLGFNTNLTPNNIYIERKFREKVEEFLNEPTEKLYRSATEGNCMVYIMGTSLTPNQQLGRMISEFSATACEINEFTIDHLRDLQWIKSQFTPEEREQFLIHNQFSLNKINILDSSEHLYDKSLEDIRGEVPEAEIANIHVYTITYTNTSGHGATTITMFYADGSQNNVTIYPGAVYYANTDLKDLMVDNGRVIITGYVDYTTDPFPPVNYYYLKSGKCQYYSSNPLNNKEAFDLLAFLLNEVNKEANPKLIETGFTITKAIFGNIDVGTQVEINGNIYFYNGEVNDYVFYEEITSMKLLNGSFSSIYFEYYGYQPKE